MIIRNCDIFPIKVIFEDGEIVKVYPGKTVNDDVKNIDKIFGFFNKELVIPKISKTRNDLCLVNIYNEKFNIAKTLIYLLLFLIFCISISEPKSQAMSVGLFSLLVIILSFSIYFINAFYPQLTFIENLEKNSEIIKYMTNKYGFFAKTKRRFFVLILILSIMLFLLIINFFNIDIIENYIMMQLYMTMPVAAVLAGLTPVNTFSFLSKIVTPHYYQDTYFSISIAHKYYYLTLILGMIMLYNYFVFLIR